ncbi:MAG: hypothetical protein J6B68_03135 [Lachnospiraceae bacterium]|nr:hypothetical protein [Lachnospiraceae bacterium]
MRGKEKYYIERTVLIIYAMLHLLMAIVHEPWFDEAEAWQIARSASLQTLLTEVTHYEGHPPLWHLVLMPLAKGGAPYELTLTLVSLLFSGVAIWLILRFSPFPRIVRILIPFTYFFFYQYGVISRVYCMMMLEFVLLAMAYKHRNEKPGRYVGVMALLCVTSAYGIIFAGGIATVWLCEILREECKEQINCKKILQDKRLRYLAGLLLIAILVILQILPREDTYATQNIMKHETAQEMYMNLFMKFLYMVLVLPADVTITNVADYSSMVQFSPEALLSGCIIGIMIWAIIIYVGKKKHTLSLFLVPYSLFAIFGAVVYLSLHHIGIGLLFMFFWIWVTMEKQEEILGVNPYFLKIVKFFVGLSIGMSLFWTISACVLDVQKEYSPGRSMAEFIKTNGLDQYRIMAQWNIKRDEKGEIEVVEVNSCEDVTEFAPYFKGNIVYNYNFGRDDRNYITHIWADEEETEYAYRVWKSEGYPEILIMNPELNMLYDGEELSYKDYALVYYAADERIWKNITEYHGNYIYVRRDLLAEIGLEEVKVQDLW